MSSFTVGETEAFGDDGAEVGQLFEVRKGQRAAVLLFGGGELLAEGFEFGGVGEEFEGCAREVDGGCGAAGCDDGNGLMGQALRCELFGGQT